MQLQLQLQTSYLMDDGLVSFALFVVCMRPTQPYSCLYGKLKGSIGAFQLTGGKSTERASCTLPYYLPTSTRHLDPVDHTADALVKVPGALTRHDAVAIPQLPCGHRARLGPLSRCLQIPVYLGLHFDRCSGMMTISSPNGSQGKPNGSSSFLTRYRKVLCSAQLRTGLLDLAMTFGGTHSPPPKKWNATRIWYYAVQSD